MYTKSLVGLGFADLIDISFQDLLDEFLGFSEMFISVTDYIRQNDFKKDICHEALDDFYLEGWYFKFAGQTGFYELSLNFTQLISVIKRLHSEGEDVAIPLEKVKEAMSEIWQRLPDFYRAHEIAEFKTEPLPPDYDKNLPYPQLMKTLP